MLCHVLELIEHAWAHFHRDVGEEPGYLLLGREVHAIFEWGVRLAVPHTVERLDEHQDPCPPVLTYRSAQVIVDPSRGWWIQVMPRYRTARAMGSIEKPHVVWRLPNDVAPVTDTEALDAAARVLELAVKGGVDGEEEAADARFVAVCRTFMPLLAHAHVRVARERNKARAELASIAETARMELEAQRLGSGQARWFAREVLDHARAASEGREHVDPAVAASGDE
jgi:hypothetical protein